MLVRSLTAGALLATAACSSVQPVLNAREFIPAKQPEKVWVVNKSNESYVLTAPRVEGDNIVGTLLNSQEEMRIPLGQAQLVEARQRDKGKSLAVGVILGVVAAGTIYMVAQAGNGNVDPGSYTGEM
jgi:hypothetical protein